MASYSFINDCNNVSKCWYLESEVLYSTTRLLLLPCISTLYLCIFRHRLMKIQITCLYITRLLLHWWSVGYSSDGMNDNFCHKWNICWTLAARGILILAKGLFWNFVQWRIKVSWQNDRFVDECLPCATYLEWLM